MEERCMDILRRQLKFRGGLVNYVLRMYIFYESVHHWLLHLLGCG